MASKIVAEKAGRAAGLLSNDLGEKTPHRTGAVTRRADAKRRSRVSGLTAAGRCGLRGQAPQRAARGAKTVSRAGVFRGLGAKMWARDEAGRRN
jgi:hypothetical protein